MRERTSENARSLRIYFIFQFSEFSFMLQLLSNFFLRLSLLCLPSFVKYRYRFPAVCGYFFDSSFLRDFFSLLSYIAIFAYLGCHKLWNKMNASFSTTSISLQLLPIKIYEMWEIERTKIKLRCNRWMLQQHTEKKKDKLSGEEYKIKLQQTFRILHADISIDFWVYSYGDNISVTISRWD